MVIDVTLDTNVSDRPTVRELKKAARGLPFRFASTTPTIREGRGSSIKPRKAGVSRLLLEGLVLDESQLGRSVLWSDEGAAHFERILQLMSHRAFPKPGDREHLTQRQRNQFRDALILSTHAQNGGDILITNEKNSFGDPDATAPSERQELRRELELLCSTRIMSVEAFCAHCNALRREKDARLVELAQRF